MIDDHCGTVTPVGELAARKRDGLGLEAASDRLSDRRKRIQPDPSRSTGDGQHLVVVPEGVLLLREQVRHRMTGGDTREEPERVLQVRQKPDVGVRKRRALASELEVINLGRCVRATDDVEPLLHFVLVCELGAVSRSRRGEELV